MGAYIGCEKTVTGAMGLRMRRVNRLDRACSVFYRQLSDISVAVRHQTGSGLQYNIKISEPVYLYASRFYN